MSDQTRKVYSYHIPDEILPEIFQNLPVESLLKCMCVCRAWHSLIKSPSFISLYLNHAISFAKKNFHHTCFLKLCGIASANDSFFPYYDNPRFGFNVYKQLHDVPFMSHSTWVIGSCNGIIFLVIHESLWKSNLVLWNPVIRKIVSAPTPLKGVSILARFGLGFDPKTNDYKILRVMPFRSCTEYELFSLNANSWKRITGSTPQYETTEFDFIGSDHSMAFVHGAVHVAVWMAGREFILGFDMGDETFREIKLPMMSWGSYGDYLYLSPYRESSLLTMEISGQVCHVWVMKEYGVVESWTKMFSFDGQLGSWPRFSGVRKSGDLVFQLVDGRIVSLDLDKEEIQDLQIQGLNGRFSFVGNFVESLVLLDRCT